MAKLSSLHCNLNKMLLLPRRTLTFSLLQHYRGTTYKAFIFGANKKFHTDFFRSQQFEDYSNISTQTLNSSMLSKQSLVNS
jgi:hypothetical protein